ncbi:PEP-CTERM system histidine kinase PrsK [Reinekea forsetii]|nr:PEP-CTERM system histidine kinase PrsK [Reinekea forsetii]
MDYLTVSQSAFLSACLATLILCSITLYQAIKDFWKGILLIGLFGQLIWAAALFFSYLSESVNPTQLLIAEYLRYTLWLITLGIFIRKRAVLRLWPTPLKVLAVSVIVVNISTALQILFPGTHANTLLTLCFLFLAISGLVLTEQVIRNLNTHRYLKLLGLCLTMVFTFDLFVYGNQLVNGSIPAFVWQARAALALVASIALSIGSLIFKQHTSNRAIFTVSRPAAFFSSAALTSVVLVILASLGSFYIQQQGFLASYIFTVFLVMGVAIIFALLISKQFRQQFDVFVSKNFFSLKYDYRQEWLSAIRKLSSLNSGDSEEYYSKLLRILCSALKAKRGAIWINNGQTVALKTSNLSFNLPVSEVAVDEPFVKAMLKDNWIFVPQSRTPSMAENNALLPDWALESEQIWAITPLIVQMKLIGFIIIERPLVNVDVTYEDRDLMTNLSTQLSSHILLYQQESQILETKQLETYDRLSSFIMHDVNNVIAQLALIGKNAEKHRDNPAFIDDMIKTVDNSVVRMRNLIQKFNPTSLLTNESLSLKDIMTDVIDSCSDKKPIPTLTIETDSTINADKQKLTLSLKNLVRNAQEASQEDQPVTVEVRENTVIITDHGEGMTPQFIQDVLFKPFQTTKSENGMGIGAHLTKSYLEHIGASLSVESEINKGSCFTVTFAGVKP